MLLELNLNGRIFLKKQQLRVAWWNKFPFFLALQIPAEKFTNAYDILPIMMPSFSISNLLGFNACI